MRSLIASNHSRLLCPWSHHHHPRLFLASSVGRSFRPSTCGLYASEFSHLDCYTLRSIYCFLLVSFLGRRGQVRKSSTDGRLLPFRHQTAIRSLNSILFNCVLCSDRKSTFHSLSPSRLVHRSWIHVPVCIVNSVCCSYSFKRSNVSTNLRITFPTATYAQFSYFDIINSITGSTYPHSFVV
jgi:hypothetical protein